MDSPQLRRAFQGYSAVAASLVEAQADRTSMDVLATGAGSAASAHRSALVAAEARIAGLRSRLETVEAAIADLSIQLYVQGGSTARVDAALASEEPAINDHDRRAVLGSSSMDVLLAERAAYRQRIEEAQAKAEAARTGMEEASSSREQADSRRPTAVTAEVEGGRAVARERVVYEEARALASVEGVDFTLVALDAYSRAADQAAELDPACGVRWWGIAGISRVEGRHGTYGGSTLDPRGDTTKRIIGIQLNGTNQTAVIPDSDGGALDGDPVFDRAVGPMQFIPQTWGRFASDGNGDGTATPFNMYDATLAAARYLCRASGGLDADPGLRAAYFSYNRSAAYVEAVLGHARAYEKRLPLDRQD